MNPIHMKHAWDLIGRPNYWGEILSQFSMQMAATTNPRHTREL